MNHVAALVFVILLDRTITKIDRYLSILGYDDSQQSQRQQDK